MVRCSFDFEPIRFICASARAGRAPPGSSSELGTFWRMAVAVLGRQRAAPLSQQVRPRVERLVTPLVENASGTIASARSITRPLSVSSGTC